MKKQEFEEKQHFIVKASGNIPDSKFEFSAVQMNAFVNIMQNLQQYTSASIDWKNCSAADIAKTISLNKKGNHEIKIRLQDINSHAGRAYKEIEEMARMPIIYYSYDMEGKPTITKSILLNEVGVNVDGEVVVGIAPNALQWMMEKTLIHGINQHFIFNAVHCRQFSSIYTKRIYLYLSKYYRDSYFTKSIEKFLVELCAPNYCIKDMELFILYPAFIELLKTDSRLYFKWRFTKNTGGGRGRKSFKDIEFKIYDVNNKKSYHEFLTDNWSDRKRIVDYIKSCK